MIEERARDRERREIEREEGGEKGEREKGVEDIER